LDVLGRIAISRFITQQNYCIPKEIAINQELAKITKQQEDSSDCGT